MGIKFIILAYAFIQNDLKCMVGLYIFNIHFLANYSMTLALLFQLQKLK